MTIVGHFDDLINSVWGEIRRQLRRMVIPPVAIQLGRNEHTILGESSQLTLKWYGVPLLLKIYPSDVESFIRVLSEEP